MYLKLISFTLFRVLMLVIVGTVIHLLQDKDIILMLVLAVNAIVAFSKRWNRPDIKIYLIGFAISAVGGVLAELWGIHTNRWEYHDLPNGRHFPMWLPVAWGLAYSFLHSFEARYIKMLKITTFKGKLILALIVSAILPTIGEIVTVQLGVWTYYNDYKIFGIPYYAIVLLMLFHTTVFLLLTTLEKNILGKSV